MVCPCMKQSYRAETTTGKLNDLTTLGFLGAMGLLVVAMYVVVKSEDVNPRLEYMEDA